MVEKEVKFAVFGDLYQNIFRFQGADERYLLFADRIFSSSKKWVRKSISTSFRITFSMAHFINTQILKSERLRAKKEGSKVKYLICKLFSDAPFLQIKAYMW